MGKKSHTLKFPKPMIEGDSVFYLLDSDSDEEPNIPIIVEKSYYKFSQELKKVKIIDNTRPSKNSATVNGIVEENKVDGVIAYSVPDEMKVGEVYKVKIRITKDLTEKKTLIVGDTHIPLNDTTVNSTITLESIRVSTIMSALLVGDASEFTISSKSTEVQNIEQFGYTEWEWSVKPLKSGENPLKLIIKVRIISEDGEKSFKDIVVFEKNILTKTNIGYSIKNMISKYWQWSLSTLIIPFLIWLYNRKKKKE